MVLLIIAAGALAAAVFILGLPGRIAVARKHADAEAVTLLGWAGGLAVLPWMQALIWAFKDLSLSHRATRGASSAHGRRTASR